MRRTPRMVGWGLAAMCGAAPLHLRADSKPAGAPAQPVGSGVFNLRVVTESPDHTEVVLTMDYSYNGLWGPTARLLPVIEKSDRKEASVWFGSDGAIIQAGQGTTTAKVRFFTDERTAPRQITTDKINVWMLSGNSQAVVGVTPFDKPIAWGKAPFQLVSNSNPTSAPPVLAGEAASAAAAPPTQASFSAVNIIRRAPWQEHFTLGPGDELNFSLFGEPDLDRTDVAIGPDGRVSYLEAQDVLASGLTIDELRSRVDEELTQYRRTPRTIITPVAFRSKKYYLLGEVSSNGVFTLDRPLTIIEAVARARGLETGLSGRNLVELADLSRTFLVRHNERLPVDFEKLFRAGDLTQNVPLEPGDYLYFPPTNLREIYLLGEVRAPGPVTYGDEITAVRAIADAGGFTDRAWKRRILVVRGSLNRPTAYVVDAADVLAARAPDFKLQPKDIVYVSARPWIRAEELLDLAVTAFVQSAVIMWTGVHVPLAR